LRVSLSIEEKGCWGPAAEWVLGEMLGTLGLSPARELGGAPPHLVIAYGAVPAGLPPGTAVVRIPCSPSSSPDEYEPDRLEDFGSGAGRGVPPFLPDEGGPGRVRLSFDIVAPAFHILSRKEETGGERDDLDRFRPEGSWLVRRGFLQEPVVDRFAGFLLAAVEEALASAKKAALRIEPWPGGETFAVALTHDQDQALRWKRRMARHLFRSLAGGGEGRRAALRSLRSDIREGRVSPLHFTEWMWREEKRRGIRSTFFFLATPRDRFDRRYEVGSPPFREFLRRASKEGAAIGLHGGLESYRSAPMLRVERERIADAAGIEPSGVRMHYLRLRAPETWEAEKEAGFSYDASLGYPDHPGFRAGSAMPFRPLRQESFLLFPLVGMDRALLAAGIRGGDEYERWSLPVREVGGLLSILWHPYFVNREFGSEREDAFLSLLDWMEGQKRSAWITTLDEAHRWWEARRLFSIPSVSMDGERTRLFCRFGAPLSSARLTALPTSSDIRIEGTKGLRASLGGTAERRSVDLSEIEGGGEITLSLLPRRRRGER